MVEVDGKEKLYARSGVYSMESEILINELRNIIISRESDGEELNIEKMRTYCNVIRGILGLKELVAPILVSHKETGESAIHVFVFDKLPEEGNSFSVFVDYSDETDELPYILL